MEQKDKKKTEYVKRLLLSRMRILNRHGFYGLLLMHMEFALDDNCETACTDGKIIYFGTEFLESLSDDELDFIMMHEILHVVLRHCSRNGDRDEYLFNIACDIVVNSNILYSNDMDKNTITLKEYGESIHTIPNGKEGYEYTAEQVYEILMEIPGIKRNKKIKMGWDDHEKWGGQSPDNEDFDIEKALWASRFKSACEAAKIRDENNGDGKGFSGLPAFAERMLQELNRPQIDWRTVLNEFVQEEVVDYSFAPPDRRFSDTGFFLPDFNETETVVKDVLFMIDSSGSMSSEEITAVYSEVKGAIDQFDGKLQGWLGFFDSAVIPPVPFTDESEMLEIKPTGGGGTSFDIIFDYVREEMSDELPASIIIMTDGYAEFPEEELAMDIPVLWVINNDSVKPSWGKLAVIK